MSNEPETASISRVQRSREEAQASYNRISRWYDLLQGHWEKAPRETGLRLLDLAPGEQVLEVGFGTGHGLVAMAQAVGDGGFVVGVDLAQAMVAHARKLLRSRELDERVSLVCGDALNLPLATASFDAAYQSFALELFDTPEIPLVLAEFRRVLRPGGRIAVVALTKEGKPSRAVRLYEWGHEHFPRLLDCRPIYVQRSLEAAGFAVQAAEIVSMGGLHAEAVLATAP